MNKVALITGAAGGIGYEFAKIALRKGFDLALVDINEQSLAEKAQELKSLSANSVSIPGHRPGQRRCRQGDCGMA